MPLAEAIRRNRFNRRYAQVGRALLGQLADIYKIDIATAETWADAFDVEQDSIAGGVPACPDGIAGRGGPPESPLPATPDFQAT